MTADQALEKMGLGAEESWVTVYQKAINAGMTALQGCTPTPMIVTQHENAMDDNSPAKKQYYVGDGMCGFASVTFLLTNGVTRQFIGTLKKALIVGTYEQSWDTPSIRIYKNNFGSGYSFSVREGNQSYEKKTAFAKAMSKVLEDAGINCYWDSRVD